MGCAFSHPDSMQRLRPNKLHVPFPGKELLAPRAGLRGITSRTRARVIALRGGASVRGALSPFRSAPELEPPPGTPAAGPTPSRRDPGGLPFSTLLGEPLACFSSGVVARSEFPELPLPPLCPGSSKEEDFPISYE